MRREFDCFVGVLSWRVVRSTTVPVCRRKRVAYSTVAQRVAVVQAQARRLLYRSTAVPVVQAQARRSLYREHNRHRLCRRKRDAYSNSVLQYRRFLQRPEVFDVQSHCATRPALRSCSARLMSLFVAVACMFVLETPAWPCRGRASASQHRRHSGRRLGVLGSRLLWWRDRDAEPGCTGRNRDCGSRSSTTRPAVGPRAARC